MWGESSMLQRKISNKYETNKNGKEYVKTSNLIKLEKTILYKVLATENMITALGEILIDYTPQGKSETGMQLFEQNAGGAPANVCVAISKLGKKAAFIGKVGDDLQGHFLIDTLNKQNIDTRNVIIDDYHFTTLAFVSLSESGERSFSFARRPGADTQLKKEEINLELLKETKIFHFGSLSLTDNPSREATFFAIDNAKAQGAIISYDPNYRKPLWQSEELAIEYMRMPINKVDIIKISDEECKLITGEADPYIAVEFLLDYVKIAVVTLGKDGAIFGFNGVAKQVEGFKVDKVADTTGAGDAFWGGFLYSLSSYQFDSITFEEIEQCVIFGTATASLCIEKFGAIPAMPTYEEVENRLLKLKAD